MSEEIVVDQVQWKENLPSELADAPYFKNAENINQVVADLQNAAKLQGNLGESHLRIPPPEAAEEDINAFREKVLKIDPSLVTRPEDYSPVPDEYAAPEGFEGDFDAIVADAKRLNLTEKQFTELMGSVAEKMTAATEGKAQWKADQQKVLAEKLGAAKDDHMARTVAKLMDISPDLSQALAGGEMSADVALALDTLVHNLIEMGGESGQFNEQAGATSRGLTPEEANAKSFELRAEMQNMPPGSPQYEAKLAKLVEYQRLASGHH